MLTSSSSLAHGVGELAWELAVAGALAAGTPVGVVGVGAVPSVWTALRLVLGVAMAPYMNAGLPISQAWSYVPLAIGGALIALFAIERIVAAILKIKVIPSWH